MEHYDGQLVRELYGDRTRNDADAISSILDETLVWHKPELKAERSGDLLHGSEAVRAKTEELGKIAVGTFSSVPQHIVAKEST